MFLKLLTISVCIALAAIYVQFFTSPHKALFTLDELKSYNGIDKPELYLAIMGKIFNVTKGLTHYGPGASYNFFIGKDASRAFITGKLDENGGDDDVTGLSPEELLSLKHWMGFYEREYEKIGKLIGRYYQSDGKLTQYGREVRKLLKIAQNEKEEKELREIKFPSCNVEWNPNAGSRVWCSERSGGIPRDWVGYPRQLYEPGSKDHRCVCVQTMEISGNLKEYHGCDINSHSCHVKP